MILYKGRLRRIREKDADKEEERTYIDLCQL